MRAETGNTPTGVGKSLASSRKGRSEKKHPHGRGEERSPRRITSSAMETPPRAWGRVEFAILHGVVVGNTPTGVGKTEDCEDPIQIGKKHPHGRGEDSTLKIQVAQVL